MNTYILVVDMKDRRDETSFTQTVLTPAANDFSARAGADNLGVALAVASGGVLVCVATQVIDTGLDWSLPMIDAEDRVIEVDWDEEYPHD